MAIYKKEKWYGRLLYRPCLANAINRIFRLIHPVAVTEAAVAVSTIIATIVFWAAVAHEESTTTAAFR